MLTCSHSEAPTSAHTSRANAVDTVQLADVQDILVVLKDVAFASIGVFAGTIDSSRPMNIFGKSVDKQQRDDTFSWDHGFLGSPEDYPRR
mmetsp:Transcript_39410/g.156491  ORF Transcript_39410/g.156491 Transcript_39410/m.156491 type:complete len:90 (-) Transcript_39410:1765-2034(-)